MRAITLLVLMLTACGTVDPPCECADAVRAWRACLESGDVADLHAPDCSAEAEWAEEVC